MDAALGGDPGLANKVRAYLSVRFYKGGRWEDRLEVRETCFLIETNG